MNQEVLNSNANSVVEKTLTAGAVKSLAYITNESYPNISKTDTLVSPYLSFTASPDGQSHTFNIPRSGFNYGGMLRFDSTWLADLPVTSVAGFDITNLILNIQFVSAGQPILTITGEGYRAMLRNLDNAALQTFARKYTRLIDPDTNEPRNPSAVVTAGLTSFSYLPVLASWYGSIEKALNVGELTQIQLVISYKGGSLPMGLAATPSSLKCNFQCLRYMPDADTYKRMLQRDFSAPLIMEGFNTLTERLPLIAGNTLGVEFKSSANQAIYKTHVFVQATGVIGSPYHPITRLSVSVGGQPYLNRYTPQMINFGQAFKGMFSDSVIIEDDPTAPNQLARNKDHVLTIDWSLECHRDSNTGLASFAGLNRPDFSVEWATLTTPSQYSLYLVHEYWNVLEIDSTKTLMVRANT